MPERPVTSTPAPRAARLVWPLVMAREDREGVTVFAPTGRLGTLSSGELIDTLASAIEAGVRRIVLDLSGVDYLSSAGLLALHALLGRLAGAGGDLVLCGLAPPVRISFELSGFLPDYVEEPSLDRAVARVRELNPETP
jgi:anti-anti-sigma factor